MEVEAFYDERTATLSYVVHDPGSRVGVVIDPVLDFDPASGRCWTGSAEAVFAFIDGAGLRIPYVLDTHAHADHLSAMDHFRERYDARSGIGSGITRVQETFRDLFHLGSDFPCDGSQFDLLLDDGAEIDVGPFGVRVLHTPGHTPGCVSYAIGDLVFVGDVLFQPDYGTARCDFPGGDAGTLFESVTRLYRELAAGSRVFTCHDYRPGGRPVAYESTIEEQRRGNVQLDEKTRREDFVRFRRERDAELAMPALILPSVQVNIRAGRLPAPEANGVSYLKIPVNALGGAR